MAIRFAHGAERHLADLRPAADDDDALAEDAPEAGLVLGALLAWLSRREQA